MITLTNWSPRTPDENLIPTPFSLILVLLWVPGGIFIDLMPFKVSTSIVEPKRA